MFKCRRLFLLSTILLTTALQNAFANNELVAKEYELRGAFIFQIANRLAWKPQPKNIVICFAGGESGEIKKALDYNTKRKKLQNITTLSIEHIQQASSSKCNILYIEDLDVSEQQLQNLSKSVFTITNDPELLSRGVILSIIVDPKPLISLSRGNLLSSRVEVDSRLLTAFNIVK